MANIESLTKRLNTLDENRSYFRIEDYVLACPMPGESQGDAMFREHPFKTLHPDWVSFLLGKPQEDRSKSL